MNITTLPARPYADNGVRAHQAATRTLASNPITFSAPSEPQDKVDTNAKAGGTEVGNGIKFALGGAGALALTIPAMYAGVLGGAIVGSVFGAGLGPAVASVSTHGALGFLGGIWHSTATFAKAGMFIGGTSGLVGGWKAGTSFGKAVGRVFGAGEDPSKPADLKALHGIPGLFATVVSGAGLASGALGGATIGGGLAATGSLVAHGFSFSGMGPAAAIGAGVGALALGLVGASGGLTTARLGAKAINGTYHLAEGLWKKTGTSEPLNQKQARLDAEETKLKAQDQKLSTEAASDKTDHEKQTATLDTREKGIEKQEADANGREQAVDGRISDAGKKNYDKRYSTEKVDNGLTLKAWSDKLDGLKTQLDGFQKTQKEREQKLDAEIEQKGQAQYAKQLKPELDKFEQQLNDYQTKLDKFEQSVTSRIQSQFQSELAPKKSDLQNQIASAQDDQQRAREEKRDAERQANMANASMAQAQGDLNSARSSRDQARSEVNNLQSQIAQLRTRISNLNAEISQLRSDISSVRSQLGNG